MKSSRYFFILMLLVLTFNFISAEPPFTQQGVFTEGYIINFPPLSPLQQNQDFTFNFHVFNVSNGAPIDNSSTSCNLHLYSPNGNQQFASVIPHVSGAGITNEWEITLDKGNFSSLGEYAYVVQCNSSVLGGFDSVDMSVTADGKIARTFPIQFPIILFGFIFIAFGLQKDRYRLFKYAGSFIFLVMGVLTLYPGYAFINWTTLEGKLLGFLLIGVGFYFLIEDAFSRDEQQEGYDYKHHEFTEER